MVVPTSSVGISVLRFLNKKGPGGRADTFPSFFPPSKAPHWTIFFENFSLRTGFFLLGYRNFYRRNFLLEEESTKTP